MSIPMDAEPMDTEFLLLVDLADQLGVAAEQHDVVCCSTTDHAADCTHNHTCFNNRAFIAALVLDRLGLGIIDIGFIADKLLELQCDDGTGRCDTATDDTVLDSEEVSN